MANTHCLRVPAVVLDSLQCDNIITKVLLLDFHFTNGKVEVRDVKQLDQGYTAVKSRWALEQPLGSETLSILLLNLKGLSFLKR